MIRRIRFIAHQDKKILLIDLSNCSATEVEETFRALPDVVTTQARGSVLILCDYTGASFDLEAIRVMKETAVFDKPYVKKSAWTGKAKLPQVVSENLAEKLAIFSRREFPAFKTREEALAWLAKE
jgi:hypothetical protein